MFQETFTEKCLVIEVKVFREMEISPQMKQQDKERVFWNIDWFNTVSAVIQVIVLFSAHPIYALIFFFVW